MTHPVRILLLQTGHASEPIRSQFGDFNDQFLRAIDTPWVDLHVYNVCDVWPGTPFPHLEDFQGVLVTGSAAMLDEGKPWMKACVVFIQKLLNTSVPFLGVCFGHQLLGAALGAQVGPNPNGRANGTREVHLLPTNDVLFSKIPSPIFVQVSHRDVILEKNPGFEILGFSNHDPFHVIRAGKHAWGVQFHPEWNMDISRAYIELRRDVLNKEMGEGHAERILADLHPSPQGALILKSFVEICRQGGA